MHWQRMEIVLTSDQIVTKLLATCYNYNKDDNCQEESGLSECGKIALRWFTLWTASACHETCETCGFYWDCFTCPEESYLYPVNGDCSGHCNLRVDGQDNDYVGANTQCEVPAPDLECMRVEFPEYTEPGRPDIPGCTDEQLNYKYKYYLCDTDPDR
eukprot:UN04309